MLPTEFCNAASMVLVDGEYICYTMQCMPAESCEWGSFDDGYSAMMLPNEEADLNDVVDPYGSEEQDDQDDGYVDDGDDDITWEGDDDDNTWDDDNNSTFDDDDENNTWDDDENNTWDDDNENTWDDDDDNTWDDDDINNDIWGNENDDVYEEEQNNEFQEEGYYDENFDDSGNISGEEEEYLEDLEEELEEEREYEDELDEAIAEELQYTGQEGDARLNPWDGVNVEDHTNLEQNGGQKDFLSGYFIALIAISSSVVMVACIALVSIRCSRAIDKKSYQRFDGDSELSMPLYKTSRHS